MGGVLSVETRMDGVLSVETEYSNPTHLILTTGQDVIYLQEHRVYREYLRG